MNLTLKSALFHKNTLDDLKLLATLYNYVPAKEAKSLPVVLISKVRSPTPVGVYSKRQHKWRMTTNQRQSTSSLAKLHLGWAALDTIISYVAAKSKLGKSQRISLWLKHNKKNNNNILMCCTLLYSICIYNREDLPLPDPVWSAMF